MKKIAALLLLVVIFVTFVGCNERLAEWTIDSNTGNGVFVAVPEQSTKNGEWYCTIDYATSSILTVNLIYPDEFGEPEETLCKAGGKEIKCEVTSAEQVGADIIFYQLPTEFSSFEYDGKIVITQKFEKKTVKFIFKPKMVADAFVIDEE